MCAIPGPSVVPDRVLLAMHQPMTDIYGGALPDVTESLLTDLPAVAGSSSRAFLTIANGHGAWQMAISNTLSRGDRVLVLESGTFAVGWGEMAAMSGVKVEVLASGPNGAVDPQAVAQRLIDDPGHDISAVLTVHVDTATSVRNDIAAIRGAIDQADHPALFMVDGIASLGSEAFEMDQWNVDVVVGAGQKGLMTPPGLSFVLANERAIERCATADLRNGYFDWEARQSGPEHYLQYSGTPPVQHIYGLRAALDMLDEEGLTNVFERHELLARAVHAAVDAWGCGLSLNVADPRFRSHAVTAVRADGVDVETIHHTTASAGLTIGLGIPPLVGCGFRIGHMGHLNPPMLLGTLGTLEASLLATGLELEASGVAAAAAALAPTLAA